MKNKLPKVTWIFGRQWTVTRRTFKVSVRIISAHTLVSDACNTEKPNGFDNNLKKKKTFYLPVRFPVWRVLASWLFTIYSDDTLNGVRH